MKFNLFVITILFFFDDILPLNLKKGSPLLDPSDQSNEYFLIESKQTDFQLIFFLKYKGKSNFYSLPTNLIIQNIQITIFYQSDSELRIKINDSEKSRWEIPEKYPFVYDNDTIYLKNGENRLYMVEFNKNPFDFKIKRVSTNEIIFDSSSIKLIYSDQYLQFGSFLPSDYIFGLGERVHQFKLKIPGTYTLWNQDLPGIIDDGLPGKNTYGEHPVYLMKEKNNYYHMVYLRNSNAMDIILDKINDRNQIIYKIIGGIIDFKIFLGDKNPQTVIKQYHKYIGGYNIQPFWSFGFHQSRWGYENSKDLEKTIEQYKKNKLPLDGVWLDIDYMIDKNTFTIDESRFDLNFLNNGLKSENKKLILIIDPGVARHPGMIDSPYFKGESQDIFLKEDFKTNYPFVGQIWPGSASVPDFFDPKTEKYWNEMLDNLRNKVNFDGLWLDMNEISIFKEEKYSEKCNKLNQRELVYLPGNKSLDENTICYSVKHFDGEPEYNVHNFNGFMESIMTYNYFKNKLKISNPFIMSRSTVPGSGKYVIHWTGDNVSKYKWMKLSIAGILNFNIFGIPNVGADICGFAGNTTEKLCSRWMQLGVLYPFARNHNSVDSIHQEPYSFGDTLLRTSYKSIHFRYSILKYIYSLFVENSFGSIWKPIFFNYPEEEFSFNETVIEEEFLIGDSIMIAPILNELNEKNVYFPGDKNFWYEIHQGKKFIGKLFYLITNNLNSTAPVFIKSGSIIYRQETKNISSIEDLNNKFYLSVALDKENEAMGKFLMIENYSNETLINECRNNYNCFSNFKIKFNETNIYLEISGEVYLNVQNYLIGLQIYGIENMNNYLNKDTYLIDLNQNKNYCVCNKKNQILEIQFKEKIKIENNKKYHINFYDLNKNI